MSDVDIGKSVTDIATSLPKEGVRSILEHVAITDPILGLALILLFLCACVGLVCLAAVRIARYVAIRTPEVAMMLREMRQDDLLYKLNVKQMEHKAAELRKRPKRLPPPKGGNS